MPRPDSVRVAAVGAALVVVTFAAFSGVLTNSFVNYDDGVYVAANAHVLPGVTAAGVGWAFTTTENSNWHPVTWLSHMLDVQLYGLDAGKHHLTNLLLHCGNVALLFLLLVRMTGALWRPAFVAALFAVHPLHVESVAWIAERKDVLSTLFWFLTVGAWLRWLDSKTAGRYAAVLLLYACGLMAKPMLVTLPLTLMLLDYWPLGRAARAPLWKEKVPLFVMAALSCLATVLAQRAGGALQTLESFAFPERLANAASAYAGYLIKTAWPVSLAVFYPHPHVGLGVFTAVVSAIAIAGVTVLALRFRRTAPYFAVGWLWYLGTLVPVIGLVQVGQQAMADRYTYVPLIGVFIVVAWGLADAVRLMRGAQPVAVAAAGGSIAALCWLTSMQVAYWTDSATLFRHALAVTSGNWMAHNNLGGVLSEQGQTDAAIAQFEETLRIRPGFAEAHYNMALAFDRSGRPGDAIAEYEAALNLNPGYAAAHYNLGNTLLHAGRLDEAIAHYEQAVRLRPDHAEAHNNLAIALGRSGRLAEAVAHYREALRLKPDFEAARANLSLAEQRQGAHP
jgi:tetratricopeptide (TPR) repeat protein